MYPGAAFLLLTAAVVGFTAALLKLYSSFSYFSKRNFPYARPKSLLGSGNPSSSFPYFLLDMYRRCGDNRLMGYFVLWFPAILVKDLDLIKLILGTNSSSFYDRGIYHDEKVDPLSVHLFALEGDAWKKVRAKISPAFTPAKTMLMFPTIKKNAERMLQYIGEQPSSELECCDVVGKYTLSNIANTAFGLETDVFEEDSTFLKMCKVFFTPSLMLNIKSFMLSQSSNKFINRLIGLKMVSTHVSNFFLNVIKDTVAHREANNLERPDFLQMLMQLKNQGYIDQCTGDNVRLTLQQMTAHSFLFILGGFDTSALAQSWALYELALNQEVQRRLQVEVDDVQDWSYEDIMALPYLDMVISETLRKYPSLPFIFRKCSQDFRVPDSDLVIEKGTDVNISLYGLHMDPDLFPDPDKFIPERFGPNPPHEIKPYSYMPFGEGHRYCIGMRFGKMQVKFGLALTMKHYSVEATPRTDIPAVFHPYGVQTTPLNGVWLRFNKRTTDLSTDMF